MECFSLVLLTQTRCRSLHSAHRALAELPAPPHHPTVCVSKNAPGPEGGQASGALLISFSKKQGRVAVAPQEWEEREGVGLRWTSLPLSLVGIQLY